jgi:hypothetical protein
VENPRRSATPQTRIFLAFIHEVSQGGKEGEEIGKGRRAPCLFFILTCFQYSTIIIGIRNPSNVVGNRLKQCKSEINEEKQMRLMMSTSNIVQIGKYGKAIFLE